MRNFLYIFCYFFFFGMASAQDNIFIQSRIHKNEARKIFKILENNAELIDVNNLNTIIKNTKFDEEKTGEKRLLKLINKVLPTKYRKFVLNNDAQCIKLGMINIDTLISNYFYKVIDTTFHKNDVIWADTYLVIIQKINYTNAEPVCHLLVYKINHINEEFGHQIHLYTDLTFELFNDQLKIEAIEFGSSSDLGGPYKGSETIISLGYYIRLKEYKEY